MALLYVEMRRKCELKWWKSKNMSMSNCSSTYVHVIWLSEIIRNWIKSRRAVPNSLDKHTLWNQLWISFREHVYSWIGPWIVSQQGNTILRFEKKTIVLIFLILWIGEVDASDQKQKKKNGVGRKKYTNERIGVKLRINYCIRKHHATFKKWSRGSCEFIKLQCLESNSELSVEGDSLEFFPKKPGAKL